MAIKDLIFLKQRVAAAAGHPMQTGDLFGFSAAASSDGNTVVVTAPFEDGGDGDPLLDSGTAYIFSRSGSVWTQEAIIRQAGGRNDSNGGYGRPPVQVGISADGNTVVIGDGESESAKVFVRSGVSWTQQAILTASDSTLGHKFGFSTSISSDGNTIAVGAKYHPHTTIDAGAVYIFARSGSTWTQQAKRHASDSTGLLEFGYSVALSSNGNTLAVGATNNSDTGGVYILTRSGTTWSNQAKKTASDGTPTNILGFSVAISGDGNTVVSGAIAADTPTSSNTGAAYVFTRSGTTWSQQAKLTAVGTDENLSLGMSVSLATDGNTLVVGSKGGFITKPNAYMFTRAGSAWSQQSTLASNDLTYGAAAISGDGNTVVLGESSFDLGAVIGYASMYDTTTKSAPVLQKTYNSTNLSA